MPFARASSTASRWARISWAIGSRSLVAYAAPVAATSPASPSGASPNIQVSRPGWAMLIGPWRYSMAG